MSSWDDWADSLSWEGEDAGKPKETLELEEPVTPEYEVDAEKVASIPKTPEPFEEPKFFSVKSYYLIWLVFCYF